jgi:flagellar hook-associated protein 3 FlgL
MSSSRVNPNITPDLLAGLQTAQQQLNETVLELSTGRSINSPSDNPAGTADLVLNLAAQAQNDSFQQNISDLQTRMQTADSSLESAVNIINQAITLGVSGGGSDLTTQQRGVIATQLQGIQQQLVSIANTSVSGTYLFAGTLVETTPFTIDPTAPAGVTYSGNSSTTSVEINNGQSVNVNVPGDQLFLNPSGSLLGSVNQLITALQTKTGISAANVALGQAASEFEAQTVNYGTTLSQLASTGTELATDGVQLSAQESAIDGANIAEVATQFTQANVAYQTLLEAEGKVLSLPNLLSFIS